MRGERWRGETGAFGNAYRPLPGLFVLCAFSAPLLFLTGCSGTLIDPRFGIAASPRVVAQGAPIPKGGGRDQAGKPNKVHAPGVSPEGYSAEGLASWYGSQFHGRVTANGEVFDMGAISAAHPTLPLPSYARVTNISNGRSIVVRVNDRGPFHGGRALDVSQRVAEVLDFKHRGMARVRIDYVGPASAKGSDDAKLLATYLENGYPPATAVASNEPVSMGPAYGDSTPAQAASRVEAGFAAISSPSPLAQQGALTQPVLSGYAFSPAFGSVR